MSNFLAPLPLNSRAAFRLLHFDNWGTNFLIDRLGLDSPKVALPKFFRLTHAVTGEIIKIPTGARYEDEVVAVMERLRLQEKAARGD